MKKNHFSLYHKGGRWKKTFLIMKLTVFLFLLTVIQATAASLYSQQGRISIKTEKMDMIEVLNLIEKESGLSFMYKDIVLIGHKDISIDYSNSSISVVLKELFKGKGLEYKIIEDIVVIKPVEPVTAQQLEKRTITGKVLDSSGEPITGANIYTKDGKSGTITDVNGEYKIVVRAESKILIFSFIGMITQEVEMFNQRTIDVVLIDSIEELGDVVVTGIFNRKASTFTGNVSTFKGEQLKAVSNTNVFESLKNLEPALFQVDNMDLGSDPNQTPELLLRGTSSFDLITEATSIKGTYGSSPNAPLFILDGFEATIEKVLDLNIDRVESVTILKDASAKAIYGSKAANGVIVIETVSNPEGDLLLTYDGGLSLEVPDLTSYDLMNAAEKLQFEVDYGLYDGRIFSEDSGTEEQELYQQRLRAVLEGVDTDWLAIPLRNSVSTRHRLGFQMSTKTVRLIAGFSYNNRQGAMKESDRTNYSGDISVSYRKDKLRLQNRLSITSNVSNDSPYGSFFEYASMNPYYSPYDREGNIVEHPPLKDETGQHADRYWVGNPLYNSQVGSVIMDKYLDVTNNIYAEYYWNDFFKTSVRFGITLKNTAANEFYPAAHTKFRRYTSDDLLLRKGSFQVNDGEGKTMSGDFNLTYSRNLNKHFLMYNLGGQLYENSFQEVIYRAEGFPSEDMNSIIFARQYLENSKPTGREVTAREIGALAVVNYAFDNRFLFDASARATGSSQYGSNKRWGTFWSAGLGWNLHNENWIGSGFFSKT